MGRNFRRAISVWREDDRPTPCMSRQCRVGRGIASSAAAKYQPPRLNEATYTYRRMYYGVRVSYERGYSHH